MRAVLSKLAADHIVEQVTNRGVFVAQPSIDEAREVFRARRLIEGNLIRRASENPTPALRKALNAHVRHEQASCNFENTGVVIKRCGKYHQVLADQSRFVCEAIGRVSIGRFQQKTRRMDCTAGNNDGACSNVVLLTAFFSIDNARYSVVRSSLDPQNLGLRT